MSTTSPEITSTTGLTDAGTAGASISNNSATALSSTEFLNLMMDSLKQQDPLNPSSSDPTQYLTELAQMTDVEQETNTAQSTAETVQEQSVSQAIGLIGDSVSYTNQTTGATTTGTVKSVQITSSGATLTIDGTAGIALSSITNVAPQGTSQTGSASGS